MDSDEAIGDSYRKRIKELEVKLASVEGERNILYGALEEVLGHLQKGQWMGLTNVIKYALEKVNQNKHEQIIL